MKAVRNKLIRLLPLIALVCAAACAPTTRDAPSNTSGAVTVEDANGKSVVIKDASRIVSVGGSVTEIIYALDAQAQLVGVDASSVYPEQATRLPQVGYMRQVAAEGVLSLKPTLVIVAADAGTPQALAQIELAGATLLRLPPDNSVDGAKRKIEIVARALQFEARGAELVRAIDDEMSAARELLSQTESRPRVLIVIARGAGSLSVSGTGTAADEMVRLAGGVNAVTGYENYKPLTPEAVVAAAPDVVLFPSRGLESIVAREGALSLPGIAQTPAERDRRIIALDDLKLLGFSPRTGEAVRELVMLLHPELRDASALREAKIPAPESVK